MISRRRDPTTNTTCSFQITGLIIFISTADDSMENSQLFKNRQHSLIRHSSIAIRHSKSSSFILILKLMQPEIEAFLLHQIGMVSGFDNPAPVENDDAIRIADGGQPVGDHQ